jgi:hypothetical protein
MVSCSSGEGSETQKPEFTQVTTSMFVDRSALPDSSAMEYAAPTIGNEPQGKTDPVDPAECGPAYWGPPFSQMGSVGWSTMKPAGTSREGRDIRLFLAVAAERPDMKALLAKCETVRYKNVTTTVAPMDLADLPSWAVATVIKVPGATGAGVIGLYRGLYISESFWQLPEADPSADDKTALVKLFNAQVSKLEAT